MAKALTAHGVEKAKGGKARREIVDAAVPGLRLVVQPSGAKSWAFRYSFNHAGTKSRHHKKTLGRWPGMSLGDAREAAQGALRVLGRGIDPSHPGVTGDSLSAAIASYKRLHVAGLRPTTRSYVNRMLDLAATAWSSRPLNEIKRRDVIALVDVAAERGPNVGNCCLQVVSAFFAWCLSRDLVEFNPATGVRRVAKPPVRERVLDDVELIAVWNAADKVGGRYGAFTKMLMLTGCRRDEIARLEPGEIRDDAIELPAHKVKTGKSHRIALTPMMRQVLDALPKTNMRYVLTGTDAPISHGDAPKKAIVTSIAPWRFHDLRRSFATGLARLGVAPHVIELALNHRPRGIVAIYQKHRYDAEVKAAFELWSRHVGSLTKNP
jgi:integrase